MAVIIIIMISYKKSINHSFNPLAQAAAAIHNNQSVSSYLFVVIRDVLLCQIGNT